MSTFEDVLAAVRTHVTAARFHKELLRDAGELNKKLTAQGERIKRDSPTAYWTGLNFLAEIYDHFGRRDIDVTKEARALRDELEKLPLPLPAGEDPGLRVAQIRHVLFSAQAVYRTGRFGEALAIIEFCQGFVEKLSSEVIPCWGTKGLISYFLGRVYRHQNRLDDAVAAFEDSIDCYYKRVRAKTETYAKKYAKNQTARVQKTRQVLDHANYRVAKALALGIGWVKLTRGQYRETLRQNLIPAGALLSSTEDELNQKRVLLLVGAAERALAGHNHPDKLRAAVEKLKDSQTVFEERGQPHYAAKAAYELGLAHLYLRDMAAAKECQKKVDEAARKLNNDIVWQCQSLILSSRIELEFGDPDEAVTSAGAAHDLAETNKQVLSQIDALLARGRARFALEQYPLAKDDFENALRLNRRATRTDTTNPRIVAICCLMLVKSYLKLRDPQKATHYSREWKAIEAMVEHQAIHELADEVQTEMASLDKDFAIPTDSNFLDFHSRKHQLQRFLYDRAIRIAKDKDNKQRLALILGMAAPGLDGWEERFELERQLQERLESLCERLPKDAAVVRWFRDILAQNGAYSTARMALHGEDTSDKKKFDELLELAKEKGCLDFTVERSVQREPIRSLFHLKNDIARAAYRLREIETES